MQQILPPALLCLKAGSVDRCVTAVTATGIRKQVFKADSCTRKQRFSPVTRSVKADEYDLNLNNPLIPLILFLFSMQIHTVRSDGQNKLKQQKT